MHYQCVFGKVLLAERIKNLKICKEALKSHLHRLKPGADPGFWLGGVQSDTIIGRSGRNEWEEHVKKNGRGPEQENAYWRPGRGISGYLLSQMRENGRLVEGVRTPKPSPGSASESVSIVDNLTLGHKNKTNYFKRLPSNSETTHHKNMNCNSNKQQKVNSNNGWP